MVTSYPERYDGGDHNRTHGPHLDFIRFILTCSLKIFYVSGPVFDFYRIFILFNALAGSGNLPNVGLINLRSTFIHGTCLAMYQHKLLFDKEQPRRDWKKLSTRQDHRFRR